MPRKHDKCNHETLRTTPSPYAEKAGYESFTSQQLFTAATGSRTKVTSEYEQQYGIFPAPLVLPGDALSEDPRYPPQSFNSWLNLFDQVLSMPRRDTVYVAASPTVGPDAPGGRFVSRAMNRWSTPRRDALSKKMISAPPVDEVISYLQAFLHGMPVKQLPDELEYASCMGEGDSQHLCNPKQKHGSRICVCKHPAHIELRSKGSNTVTRVRVRHLGEEEDFSAYSHQLRLNDILDHAIAILPENAFSLILLVDHDLYEDESDDFCCGRAYGGGHVAVVSSAQYQPALDSWHGIDLREGHWWPGSHCETFINQICEIAQNKSSSKKRKRAVTHAESLSALDGTKNPQMTPLQAALCAHRVNCEKQNLSEANLQSVYLRSFTLTASHEVLHCFGLDHCVYHACAMQSTSSIMEDSRQPPYLCPVCESKLAIAVLKISRQKVQAKHMDQQIWSSDEVLNWKKKRNQAILLFCQGRDKDDLGFGSLGAWTSKRLEMANE